MDSTPGRMELQALVSSVVVLLDAAELQLVHRPRRALLDWQIRRVSDYIDAHLGGRILVCDLSGTLRRSEAHFARAFKRTFGLSPHAYVLRRRVERACQLMLTSEDSLSYIALACGMTDQAHFCKIFRRIVGKTPAAWRRERRAPGAVGEVRRVLHRAA